MACAIHFYILKNTWDYFTDTLSNNLCVDRAISSTARSNASSLTLEGFLYPLTFLTNCNAAARISSSVAGISAFRKVLMLRHIGIPNSFYMDGFIDLSARMVPTILTLIQTGRTNTPSAASERQMADRQ
jgi:hypothetical protein